MYRKLFVLTIIAFFFLEVCKFPAQAAILGFDTYALSEEEQSVIISKTNLEVVQDDSFKDGIQCFDVNQNGIYALALGTGSNCRVYVYDPNGVFLYGYRFYSDGDYAIGFHEDTLAIYSLRGNTIALYDAAGVCTSVQRVAITSQSYIDINEMLDRTVKDVGGRLYVLERDLDIGDSYSRFLTISESGERNVLYDVSSEHTLGQSVFLVTIVGFFLLVIHGICRKRRNTEETL